jgi:WD40 repeat protein
MEVGVRSSRVLLILSVIATVGAPCATTARLPEEATQSAADATRVDGWTWKQASGTGIYVPSGCSGVKDARFSPDGRLVAAICNETLRLWDATTGFELWELGPASPGGIAWSRTGYSLAFASENRVAVVDVQGRRMVRRFVYQSPAHWNEKDLALAFSPDGELLAAGGNESISIWSLRTGTEIQTLNVHRGASFAMRSSNDNAAHLAFSGDSRRLASVAVVESAPDGAIEIYNVKTGERSSVIPIRGVSALGTNRKGELIAVQKDGTGAIILRQLETNSSQILSADASSVRVLALSADGGYVAALSRLGRDGLFDLYDTLAAKRKSFHVSDVWQNVIAAAGDKVLAGTIEGFDLWSTDGGRLHRTRPSTLSTFVDLSRDGRWLLLQSGLGELWLWDLASTGAPVLASRLHFGPDANWKAVLRPDGSSIAIATDKKVVLVSSFTGENECGLEFDHAERIIFSADGKMLAASNSKAAVSVWEAPCGQRLVNLSFAPTIPDLPIIFAPDGQSLLVGMGNHLGRIELPTGRLIEQREVDSFDPVVPALFSHAGPPTLSSFSDLATSPDGRFVATVSPEPNVAVTVLNAATLAPVRRASGHTIAGFLPNSSIVTKSRGGDSQVWDLARADQGQPLRQPLGPFRRLGQRPFLLETGTLRFLAWPNLESSANLFVREGGEWLVVTPDSHFDGTRVGYDGVLWRTATPIFEVSPLERFIYQRYYPGLLESVLANRPLAGQQSQIGLMERGLPQVALTAHSTGAKTREPTIELVVDVTESLAAAGSISGSGAKDVRLFRNGTLVRLRRGDVFEGSDAQSGQPRRASARVVVPLVVGENRFTAYAFNSDDVKSLTAELEIERVGIRKPGKISIVFVGVDRYEALPRLQYAVADAKTSAKTLSAALMTTGAYDRSELVPLLEKSATKANVLRALSDLAERSEPEDAVILFFAGHGQRQGDRFYLMLQDYRDVAASSSTISDRELELAFEKIDSGQLMIVIDACHAGQALHSDEERRGPLNARGLVQLAYEKGIFLLAASQPYQQAVETSRYGHGLLTRGAIVEGLGQAAADVSPHNGEITAAEFLAYAQRRVPALHLGADRARGLAWENPEAGQSMVQTPRTYVPTEVAGRPWVLQRVERTSAARPP